MWRAARCAVSGLPRCPVTARGLHVSPPPVPPASAPCCCLCLALILPLLCLCPYSALHLQLAEHELHVTRVAALDDAVASTQGTGPAAEAAIGCSASVAAAATHATPA
jgi:hypothetical protein